MRPFRHLPSFVACAAAWVLGGAAAAQQGCQFVEGSGNLTTQDYGAGAITYVSTPNLVCPDGVRIRADSAASFQTSNYVQLFGHVRFEDPDRRLTAQNAEYFTTVGRLQSHGGSELVQKTDSSVIRGDEMIYQREGPDRPRAQLDVLGGRPTARLYARRAEGDSTVAADTSAAPYDIAADRILIDGENYFRARGYVEIVRADLRAFGDSVEYDQAAGTLRLTSNARMGVGGRELTADMILASMPGDVIKEVEARHGAVLKSEDLELRSPLMHVFFTDGVMGRLVAIPIPIPVPVPSAPGGEVSATLPPVTSSTAEDRARPVATADQFRIVADSLDMLAPGEVLERIHAAGSARAESSTRDSLNTPDTPPLARKDWMEGDTVVAMFERVAADSIAGGTEADSTAADYRLERLMAIGKARSLYRMEPNDSARARGEKRPAIHYVTADAITLDLDDGAITKMEVKGQTEGIHAEPGSRVVSDTLAAPAGTTGGGNGAAGEATPGAATTPEPAPPVDPDRQGAAPALRAPAPPRRLAGR